MNSKIGWQLTPTNALENKFNDGYTEIFKSGRWAFLAREVIQNSLDALREDEKVLKMKISLEDIGINEIPDCETVKKHIRGTLSIDGVPEMCKNFSESALKILNEPIIRVLKISDYNTKGVLDSDKLHNVRSKWNALIYDEGNSQKDSQTSAGSHGLGKNAPIALSTLKMAFYITKDIENKFAIEGVAKLYTSYIDGIKYEQKIYYAKKENNSIMPLNYEDCCNNLSKFFLRSEYGTDVVIVGVDYDQFKLKKEMIQSTVENFFVLIQNGQLDINLFGEELNKDTIWSIIEKYCDKPIEYTNSNIKYGLIKNYLNTYVGNYSVTEYLEDVPGAGKLKLLISKDKEITGKWVAMFRNNGMKIFDMHIRSAQQNFSAIFFPADDNVDKFLKSLENPTHDTFDPETRVADKNQRKLAIDRYNQILNWIKAKIENYTKIEIKEQDFLDGMEEYLQLEDNKNENSVVSQPEVEIIEYDSKQSTQDTMIQGNTGIGDTNPSEFNPDDGESNKKSHHTGTTNNEPGTGQRGLIKDYHNKFRTYPKVISHSNKLKIAFELEDYTEPYFNIEIQSVGDDNSASNFIPKIIEATDLATGRKLKIKNNHILDVPTNLSNVISIYFERNFTAKYKLNIYKIGGGNNEN